MAKRKRKQRQSERRDREEEYLLDLQEDISSSSGFVSISPLLKDWIRNLPDRDLYQLYGRKAE